MKACAYKLFSPMLLALIVGFAPPPAYAADSNETGAAQAADDAEKKADETKTATPPKEDEFKAPPLTPEQSAALSDPKVLEALRAVNPMNYHDPASREQAIKDMITQYPVYPDMAGTSRTKIPEDFACTGCAPHIAAAIELSKIFPERFKLISFGEGENKSYGIEVPGMSLLIDDASMKAITAGITADTPLTPEEKQEKDVNENTEKNSALESMADTLVKDETGKSMTEDLAKRAAGNDNLDEGAPGAVASTMSDDKAYDEKLTAMADRETDDKSSSDWGTSPSDGPMGTVSRGHGGDTGGDTGGPNAQGDPGGTPDLTGRSISYNEMSPDEKRRLRDNVREGMKQPFLAEATQGVSVKEATETTSAALRHGTGVKTATNDLHKSVGAGDKTRKIACGADGNSGDCDRLMLESLGAVQDVVFVPAQPVQSNCRGAQGSRYVKLSKDVKKSENCSNPPE